MELRGLALWVLLFLGGASLGSFLNVCITRWPVGQGVIHPRSRCSGCGGGIAWYDNLPVLSWFLLRAACRHCGLRISARYPLVEVAAGVIWVASVLSFGPSLTALRLATAATILLGVVMTDLQHYVIPDGFTLTGFLLSLGFSVVALGIGEQGPFAGPVDACIGAFTGAGLIAVVAWLGEIAFRKEAMGQGDVTLMAMIGAMVGPTRSILTVVIAAALGAVVFLAFVMPIGAWRATRAGKAFEPPMVPFGVFLAPAGLVALLWGEAIVTAYLVHSGL
jgi:leader peptidase (prepilin peptidase)/N-methyltransferase